MIDFELASIGALATALFLGVLLGGGYFGALWLTLRRLPFYRRSAMLIILSLAARLTLLLVGFYLILKVGNWVHLLAALTGFVLARSLLARRLKPVVNDPIAQSCSKMSS